MNEDINEIYHSARELCHLGQISRKDFYQAAEFYGAPKPRMSDQVAVNIAIEEGIALLIAERIL
jgi:hypothetical protein